MKGSLSQGTSFSKEVPEAYTFVEVEMNRIWRKTMTSGDPLLPDCLQVAVICLRQISCANRECSIGILLRISHGRKLNTRFSALLKMIGQHKPKVEAIQCSPKLDLGLM